MSSGKLIVFILIILMMLGTYNMSDNLKFLVLFILLSGHIMQDLADKWRKEQDLEDEWRKEQDLADEWRKE